MKKYSAIFIDLDNTLFDFFAAEALAIRRVFKKYGLPADDETVKLYSKINDRNWKAYEKGILPREVIVVRRFEETLSALGFSRDAKEMNETYFSFLSDYGILIPHAFELLTYLKEKGYLIFATTNGISKMQYKKLVNSGIKDFFNGVFTSEEVGFQKPSKEFFDFALKNIPKTPKEQVLVIGDSMTSDILGGVNARLDTLWFDAFGEEKIYEPTYAVKSLAEIMKIL